MVKVFYIFECKLCVKHCGRHNRNVKMNKPCFRWAYRQVRQNKYHNRGTNNVLESTRENQLYDKGNTSSEPWRIDRIL